MKLSPREVDKLLLHNAGFLAQKRLASGLRLNYTEAVALIASQVGHISLSRVPSQSFDFPPRVLKSLFSWFSSIWFWVVFVVLVLHSQCSIVDRCRKLPCIVNSDTVFLPSKHFLFYFIFSFSFLGWCNGVNFWFHTSNHS